MIRYLSLALWLACTSPLAAQDVGTAFYDMRYAGIRIATSKVTGSIDGNSFRMSLDSEYSLVIYSGTVTGRVSGRRQGERLIPQSYSMMSGSDPEYVTKIEYDGTHARKIIIEPPLEPGWGDGRVPLKAEHSQNVFDPMSAFVMASLKAGQDINSACAASLPVFTGLSRFDIVLSPRPAPAKAARVLARSKTSPAVISCAARFVPIAGHKPSNQTIKALTESASPILIDFDVELTGPVRMPRRIEIPTRFGTVVIERSEKPPA